MIYIIHLEKSLQISSLKIVETGMTPFLYEESGSAQPNNNPIAGPKPVYLAAIK